MNVNIKQHIGTWTLGYSLDKHTTSSVPIGPNEYGHMQFDTTRPEAGEALFQLKYRSDFSQVPIIAQQMYASFDPAFSSAGLIIPMPASIKRAHQPVNEIAKEFARLKGVPCIENLLVKTLETPSMKDLDKKEEKLAALVGVFTVNDVLPQGVYDVVLIDDLIDTGSSLEAATNVLIGYDKIRNVYVATVTRKH